MLPTTIGSHPEKDSDKVLRVIASRSDIGRLCGKGVSFQFEYVGYRRSLYGSNVQVAIAKHVSHHCPTYLAGVVVKNDRTIITDGMFWLESEMRNGTQRITVLEMLQSHRCLWPVSYTPDASDDPSDMDLFIPPVWGGPISRVNHIPGYKMQTDFPWNRTDITLIEGPVPGTNVKTDPKCLGRMHARVVKPAGTLTGAAKVARRQSISGLGMICIIPWKFRLEQCRFPQSLSQRWWRHPWR